MAHLFNLRKKKTIIVYIRFICFHVRVFWWKHVFVSMGEKKGFWVSLHNKRACALYNPRAGVCIAPFAYARGNKHGQVAHLARTYIHFYVYWFISHIAEAKLFLKHVMGKIVVGSSFQCWRYMFVWLLFMMPGILLFWKNIVKNTRKVYTNFNNRIMKFERNWLKKFKIKLVNSFLLKKVQNYNS